MNRIIAILSTSLLLVACHTVTAESQPATLGLYFDSQGNRMGGMPPALTVFDAYLILKDGDYILASAGRFHGKTSSYVTLECLLVEPCYCDDGTTQDHRIVVAPHPDSGELRGSYAPERSHAVLDVYDTSARRIVRLVDRELDKGTHHADWKGVDAHGISMASGVYFYRLSIGKATITKKMVLLK